MLCNQPILEFLVSLGAKTYPYYNDSGPSNGTICYVISLNPGLDSLFVNKTQYIIPTEEISRRSLSATCAMQMKSHLRYLWELLEPGFCNYVTDFLLIAISNHSTEIDNLNLCSHTFIQYNHLSIHRHIQHHTT